MAEERTDEEIEQSIRTLFAAEGRLNPANITVRVARGHVYLGGVAEDDAERQLTLDLVRSIPGVVAVTDEMVVLPPVA